MNSCTILIVLCTLFVMAFAGLMPPPPPRGPPTPEICETCMNCNIGTCYNTGMLCYERLMNKTCWKIGKDHVDRNIDLADFSAPCLILEPGVQFFGRITGTKEDDCLILGFGVELHSQVDLKQGNDFVGMFPGSLHTGDMVMGSGDDCHIGVGHRTPDTNAGSGNDVIFSFMRKTDSEEFRMGSGDDCLLFNVPPEQFGSPGEKKRDGSMTLSDLGAINQDDSPADNYFRMLVQEGQDMQSGSKRAQELAIKYNLTKHAEKRSTEGVAVEKGGKDKLPTSPIGDVFLNAGNDCVLYSRMDVGGQTRAAAGDDCVMGFRFGLGDDIIAGSGDDVVDIMAWNSIDNDNIRFLGGLGDDSVSVRLGDKPSPSRRHEINGGSGTDFCCSRFFPPPPPPKPTGKPDPTIDPTQPTRKRKRQEGYGGPPMAVDIIRACEEQCTMPLPTSGP